MRLDKVCPLHMADDEHGRLQVSFEEVCPLEMGVIRNRPLQVVALSLDFAGCLL